MNAIPDSESRQSVKFQTRQVDISDGRACHAKKKKDKSFRPEP